MITRYILVATLLFSQFIAAQTEENQDETQDENTDEHVIEDEIGFINFSAGTPFYFGDNAASKAYAYNGSFQLSAYFFVDRNLVLGATYSYTGYDVDQPELVGFIDKGSVQYVTAELGYNGWLANPKISILATAGPGYVKYKNKSQDESFRDDGFTFTGSTSLVYNLTKKIDAYISARMYLNVLSIDAPDEVEDFLNKGIGLHPSIGFKFHLL